MIKIAQSEIQSVLLQLDQAIYNHTQWYNSITRTLVCRLPHDIRDEAEDAYRQCRLGQWYYGSAPEDLRVHPGFIAIETEHRNMHQLAAKLLQSTASGDTISPLDYDSLVNTLERLRLQIYTLKRELEDTLYNLDPLTGANNRIGMLTKLREQLEMVKRHVQSCCIVMMDIDHFKIVNDTYGHSVGDMVLAASAHNVMEHLRPYDKLFRYGGEEFLVCMQNTDMTVGYEVVERVRLGVAANLIDYGGKAPLQISMSFGITSLDQDISVEQSIEHADKAMYAAKMAGRNCTRIWDASM
ncbi:MAG: diguanylate cyclase [Sulfuriferula sp.]|nr:diguanylate cyclase [Sulfuriferula sp.]